MMPLASPFSMRSSISLKSGRPLVIGALAFLKTADDIEGVFLGDDSRISAN